MLFVPYRLPYRMLALAMESLMRCGQCVVFNRPMNRSRYAILISDQDNKNIIASSLVSLSNEIRSHVVNPGLRIDFQMINIKVNDKYSDRHLWIYVYQWVRTYPEGQRRPRRQLYHQTTLLVVFYNVNEMLIKTFQTTT